VRNIISSLKELFQNYKNLCEQANGRSICKNQPFYTFCRVYFHFL